MSVRSLTASPRFLSPGIVAKALRKGFSSASAAQYTPGSPQLCTKKRRESRTAAAMDTHSTPVKVETAVQATSETTEWHPLGTSAVELRLEHTLPTGQSFRWRQTGDAPLEYTGVIGQRAVSGQPPTCVSIRHLPSYLS